MAQRTWITRLVGGLTAAGGVLAAGAAHAQAPEAAGAAPVDLRAVVRPSGAKSSGHKYQDFNDLTKDAKTYEGLITLHEKEQHLYAEIRPHLLDKPILAPMMIARGSASAGQPLNFGDEWVLAFHRVGDNVQLLRKNIHFTAPAGTPLDKAVQQNYTDSVLMALPILSISPKGGGLVVDFADIFLTDFAQLGFGPLDRRRSRWFKIRAYPNNVEIQVEATFSNGGRRRSSGGRASVVDPRGTTLVLHYSLCKAPAPGYRTRLADYRVGHFLNAVTDFANPAPNTNAKRMINRWRLEKANPKAKLSPPKKQIVWYIEDNVPIEYRPYVQDGILEWNKAFEKIGFRDAIAVRWQNERDDFEPEDINYCTLRWITTGRTFAMSALRSDPMTGEMIDGDVIFDAGWIKAWKREYAFLVGVPLVSNAAENGPGAAVDYTPLALGEIISPILAARQGYGLAVPPLGTHRAALRNAAALGVARVPGLIGPAPGADRGVALDVVPGDWGPIELQLRERAANGRLTACNYAASKARELRFAALALALAPSDDDKDKDKDKEHDKDKAKDKDKDKEHDKDKDKDKKEKPKDEGIKLPEELLGQAIKETVMHEVGHSLGLRHNFRASGMLKPEELNDTSITHVKGLTGSVMDYNPINIAPRGQKQGDYASTTIGPYDYWAIAYAYTPTRGDEAAELKKIAARSPEPDLAFATDEDLSDHDPSVNLYDMSSDPLAFGKARMEMASELLKDLDKKAVKDGEPWSLLRAAFSACIDQFGNGAALASEYIGGQSIHRDFKGTKEAHDPVVPVPGPRQREALKFLVDRALGDQAFHFSPGLLRKLATETWQDQPWSSGAGDYPVYRMVLNIQEIALDHCLDPSVLQRVQNQELLSDPDSGPLKIAEIFRALSDGIFSELGAGLPEGRKLEISTIRRNLQREYARRLSTMVLGPRNGPISREFGFVLVLGPTGEAPADARNLARMHLEELGQKIEATLARKGVPIDDTTQAHLKALQFRIKQVLNANIEANGP